MTNHRSMPLSFRCPVLRAEHRDDETADRHRRIVRTGRTKPARVTGSARGLEQSHEYRCECGHIGWSTHRAMLRIPLEETALPRTLTVTIDLSTDAQFDSSGDETIFDRAQPDRLSGDALRELTAWFEECPVGTPRLV